MGAVTLVRFAAWLLVLSMPVLAGCAAKSPPPPPVPEPESTSSELPATEKSGESAPAGEECSGTGDGSSSGAASSPSGSSSSAAGAAGGPPPGTGTPGELAAGLDHELDASLGEFDGMLEGEMQASAGRLGEVAEADAANTGSAGAGGRDEALGGASSPGGTDESETGTGGSIAGAPVESTGGANPGGQAGRNVPPDIPDGRDDDIVARQLREAAMAEEDPELSARLWDEYRKYKGLPTGVPAGKEVKQQKDSDKEDPAE